MNELERRQDTRRAVRAFRRPGARPLFVCRRLRKRRASSRSSTRGATWTSTASSPTSADLRITHVLETHIHADFASGARELAERSGAELWLSAYDAGELYEVAFPHHPDARRRVADARAACASRRVTRRATRPSTSSFLGFDLARAPTTPQVLLSGDFLFVGIAGPPGPHRRGREGRARQRTVQQRSRVLPSAAGRRGGASGARRRARCAARA